MSDVVLNSFLFSTKKQRPHRLTSRLGWIWDSEKPGAHVGCGAEWFSVQNQKNKDLTV
jgi:hypothetical protein